MHDRDRGGFDKALVGTALVSILSLALYWAMFYSMGYQSGQNERKANVEAEHYASDTANQIERECSAKAGKAARECITKIVESEREGQRNESDLAAQWKAADWVMWAGIIAGAQLLATMFGLYYVKRTLDATLKAVEDTSKATGAMEVQNKLASDAQRAWVTLRIEPRRVRPLPGDGLGLDVDLIATNIGQTAAINFELNSDVVFRGQTESSEDFIDRIHARLAQWKAKYDLPEQATLVPKDSETDNFEGDQLAKTVKWWGGPGWPEPSTQPIVLAAVLYRTINDPATIHLSWRTWYLGFNDSKKFRPFIPRFSTAIEPPKLSVIPFHTTLMHEEIPVTEKRERA